MAILKRIADGQHITLADPVTKVPGGWQGSDQTISDPGHDLYALMQSTITPPQFMLRWTSQERVALRALRGTHPEIDDWFLILDDSRLTSVDLALTATQQGVAYAANLLVPGTIPDTATRDARIAAILAY